jgi:hypothetical protein
LSGCCVSRYIQKFPRIRNFGTKIIKRGSKTWYVTRFIEIEQLQGIAAPGFKEELLNIILIYA